MWSYWLVSAVLCTTSFGKNQFIRYFWYSYNNISMKLNFPISGQTNVARKNGVTCSASQNEADCGKIYDGVSSTSNVAFKWDFFGPAAGNWIRIFLPSEELIGSARVMENQVEKSLKDIELRFSDGSTQQVREAGTSHFTDNNM